MRRSAVLLVITVLAAACTSSGGDHVRATSSGRAVNATSAPLLPTDRFELPDVTPARFDRLLVELRGTPVVVNVWGSWCGPCREEGPRLAAAARGRVRLRATVVRRLPDRADAMGLRRPGR